MYLDISESVTFPFWIPLPSTLIRRIQQWIWIFFNLLLRVNKKPQQIWSLVNGESGYFQVGWRSKIVSSLLLNNKPIGSTISRPMEWIWIPSRVWTGLFDFNTQVWMGKFLNPERKSCRFKEVRAPSSLYLGDKFESCRGLRCFIGPPLISTFHLYHIYSLSCKFKN